MKKYIAVLMIIVSVLALSACGSSSTRLNENNIRTAKSIINAVDSYLDGNSSAKSAHGIVDTEYYNIKEQYGQDDIRASLDVSLFSSNALLITIELSAMAYDGSGDISKIKKYRNEIADLAGLPRYK